MNKFLFKYTTLVWILLAVVVCISATGLVYSVINLVNQIKTPYSQIASTIIIAIVNLFLLVFSVSVLVYGRYVIKGEYLYTYFGFIRTKVDIKTIVKLTHFKKSDSLVAYFEDAKFTVIVISSKDYEKFIEKIREVNPKIYFDTTQTQSPL